MGQHHPIEFLFDIGKFHRIGLEEISAGRHVEKQVFHCDRRTVGRSRK